MQAQGCTETVGNVPSGAATEQPHPTNAPHRCTHELELISAPKWGQFARWHPYRLRHSAATRIRAQHGIEAARVLLGHTSAGMTEVYAEADLEHAAKVALQTG